MWDTIYAYQHLCDGRIRERRERSRQIFKEIMAENLPDLLKETLHMQEAHELQAGSAQRDPHTDTLLC